MDRQTFLKTGLNLAGGAVAAAALKRTDLAAAVPQAEPPPSKEKTELAFVGNWLTDLFEAFDAELDPAHRMALMEACGRGCYRRFPFKQEIARKGRGSVENLMEALRANFEVWREGDLVHIRYGKVSAGCFCPAAKHRPPRPGDLHCECTRAMHQAIWEAALGRKYKIDILESVRRGGKTCHFAVHLG
jgi:hypothetical protein